MDQSNHFEDITSSGLSYDGKSGRDENSTLGTVKAKVAQGLKSAAESLKAKGPQTGDLSGYVDQTSRWLDNAGTYVEDISTSRVKSDIQNQMRSNPGRSLLIAGAVGLIVGSLFRRR
jgi:ElaB/YqjD/DUF883 family membrane-anchored ribosome-binding protein